ncbi:MAG: anti-sigma F factor [Ruminococcaceae bacterium]|nr:anti-sigma F factor [Oscillospiraceae bacterium]
MKAINSFTLTMLSRSTNEAFARSAVSAFVTCLDPTLEEINDIKTAVSEAVTNCIVHGYRDTIGKIYITVQIFPDNVVSVKVRDTGCGIEDIEKAKEPLFTTAGGERAGLGFAVMESFMDSLKVTSKVGKGTTVTMKKRISVRVKSHER